MKEFNVSGTINHIWAPRLTAKGSLDTASDSILECGDLAIGVSCPIEVGQVELEERMQGSSQFAVMSEKRLLFKTNHVILDSHGLLSFPMTTVTRKNDQLYAPMISVYDLKADFQFRSSDSSGGVGRYRVTFHDGGLDVQEIYYPAREATEKDQAKGRYFLSPEEGQGNTTEGRADSIQFAGQEAVILNNLRWPGQVETIKAKAIALYQAPPLGIHCTGL